jgi:signal transduction histidine kinase
MENPPAGDIRIERQRIARRLHDSVGQSLAGLKMMLGSAADAGGTPIPADLLKGWAEVCDRALSELREAVEELDAPQISHRGLEGALHRLVSETGGDLRLRVEGEGADLTAAGADALLLAAREGVANARKHSIEGRVEVVLEYEEDQAALRVRSSVARRAVGSGLGLGLGLVREAVAREGGRLDTIQDQDHFDLVATIPRPSEGVMRRVG